jgi:hypothetical protein
MMVLLFWGSVGFVHAGDPQIFHDSPASYEPGGVVTISNSFAYTDTLLALLWKPVLPEGWIIENVTGDGNPEYDDVFNEIVWTGSLPDSPITMEYTVRVPEDATGSQSIAAEVEYQFLGTANPSSGYADPNPLSLDFNCEAPTIAGFSVEPSRLSPGTTTRLSWTLSGATSARIDQGIGTVDPSVGSTEITPKRTTTFTLTASNACGTVTQTVTVTVNNNAFFLVILNRILLE